MISAKLIKDLEARGFSLDFPNYSSIEDEISEILKENNQRLFLALPLLLQSGFNYEEIISRLEKLKGAKKAESIKKFNSILLITNKILTSEGKDNRHIQEIIKKNRIRGSIPETEFQYFYSSYKEFIKKTSRTEEKILEQNIRLRTKLSTNKSLSAIFSEGKLRIMDKIFKHEPLTNTELKYYYRSIRPLILSISNEDLQKYVYIIETIKKSHIS